MTAAVISSSSVPMNATSNFRNVHGDRLSIDLTFSASSFPSINMPQPGVNGQIPCNKEVGKQLTCQSLQEIHEIRSPAVKQQKTGSHLPDSPIHTPQSASQFMDHLPSPGKAVYGIPRAIRYSEQQLCKPSTQNTTAIFQKKQSLRCYLLTNAFFPLSGLASVQ